VVLAKQQAESIEKMIPYKVSILCGEKGVDIWKMEKWLKELDEHHILVATAQVIADALKHAYLKLEQVNVMIFDECHHGKFQLFSKAYLGSVVNFELEKF